MRWKGLFKKKGKLGVVSLILISLVYAQPDVFAANTWKRLGDGFQGEAVTAVYYDEGLPLILAASRNGIYVSKNRSDDFHPAVIFLDSTYGVYQFFKYEETFYAAADNGLWVSFHNGKDWQKIFQRRSHQEGGNVYSVYADQYNVIIGTDEGVYIKNTDDDVWRRRSGELGRMPVFKILSDGTYRYFSTQAGIYREEVSGIGLKKVFQADYKDPLDDENGRSSWYQRNIRDITVNKNDVVVVTQTGVFFSKNQGKVWDRLEAHNFPSNDGERIIFLSVIDPSHGDRALSDESSRFTIPAGPLAILAAQSGVYFLEKKDWHSMVNGLSTPHAYDITQCGKNCLMAATDHGLFSAEIFMSQDFKQYAHQKINASGDLNCYEPSINAVHRMAIRYADVSRNKIEAWKRQARWKSLLPGVSLGLDRGGTDIYHWDTGQSPDVLMEGDEYVDWDISLSWDLSDIVWSTDQTSIDSRAKLMVELREDILDQVTRIYFERKRLMRSVNREGIQEDDDLRISELTALLDAFTGGQFSSQRECDL